MTYAVVDLRTSAVIATCNRLPQRVHVPGVLRADFDAVGQVAMDGDDVAFKLVAVERIGRPSEFHVQGAETVSFNGTVVVVDPQWSVDVETVRSRVIERIKANAYDAIVAIVPEWKQRNLTAQATMLLKKGQANWTAAEQAAWDQGEAIWAQVAQVRYASDAAEIEVNAIGDASALIAWAGENL